MIGRRTPRLDALALTGTAAAVLFVWFAVETMFSIDGPLAAPVLNAAVTSRALVHASMALTFAFAVVHADEAVDRGSPAFPAYGAATVAAAFAGALLQFGLHHLLGWSDGTRTGAPVRLVQMARIFLEYLLWGAALIYAYAGVRADARADRRLKAVLLGRARLQRRATEATLLALQARVEPRFLFDTLARVRTLYGVDGARAGSLLAGLVAFLRAALPHDAAEASTLARELELVRAYLAVRQQRPGDEVLEVHAGPAALNEGYPPHVLLPAIQVLLDATCDAPARIRVEIDEAPGARVLRLTTPEPWASTPDVDDIRARLRALCGDAARLTPGGQAAEAAALAISLPEEPADP